MRPLDTTYRRGLLLLVALSVVLGSGLVLWAHSGGWDAPSTGSGGGGTVVDSCTTISEPGEYVLAADVTDSGSETCIRIRSDDVVLEGEGHAVDGVGTFGTAGVVVAADGGESLSNVTVRNVTVTDWDDGIRFVSVDDSTVIGTTTAENRVGVFLLNAGNNTLADNHARSNRLRGIVLFEDSGGNTLANNTARDNAFGISLVESGARENVLVGNVAVGNEFGFVLIGAHGNELLENEAADNRIAGIWLTAARDNTFARNAVSAQFYGFFLSDRSNDNRVLNNTATANDVGIRLRASNGTSVTGNVVRDSRDTAILLVSSDDNEVVGNDGSGNARGVSVVRSAGNYVANNSVGT